MSISAARTLALADYLPANTRGVTIAPPAMWWPPKQPLDALDFSLDVSAVIAADDAVIQVTAWSSPSGGSMDLQVIDLTAAGAVITAFLTGGAPGVSYAIAVAARSAAGRYFEWIASIEVLSETPEIGVPLAAPLPSQIEFNIVADTAGVTVANTSGAALLRTRAVWTSRFLTDSNGRSVTNTRGLPILRAA